MTTALFLRGLRRCAFTLATAAALISCGASTASTVETSSGGIAVVTDRRAAPDVPTSPPTTVANRDDLLDEHRIAPTVVEVDPADPATLVVRFEGGVAPCHGVRLAVDEGPAEITVVLFAGTPPEGADAVCPAIVIEHEMRWTLERPLGTREIYWDGT